MPPELKETEETSRRPAAMWLPTLPPVQIAPETQAPVYPPPGALAALMEQWLAEDAAMSEEEKAQAVRDTAEFKANMNANRAATGERSIYR